MSDNGFAFCTWLKQWDDIANYPGRKVPSPEERIERLLRLWHEPIPGNWHRSDDRQLTGERYRRADFESPSPEHSIEKEILHKCFAQVLRDSDRLIDGINAVPLAKDTDGGRRGNKEADLLLVFQYENEYQQALCEVKNDTDTAWHAAIQNLRQLRLFLSSRAAQSISRRRLPELSLADPLPTEALVIAPRGYYFKSGKKAFAFPQAMILLSHFRRNTGIPAHLAFWDASSARITQL